jgi:ABC-type antimicrobial peptide transport system permease subunit
MRPAADRLNEFNAVQNTYLSIFSTLGGLGLFLGTLGLAILVGRNVMERRGQLGVMQAMGFTRRALSGMVLSEHWFLHLSGVVVGLGAAILAVLPKLTVGSAPLPWGLLAAINGAVLIGGLLFCAAAARTVLRGHLMDAIRRE